MKQADIDGLRSAVERQHGAPATFRATEQVRETVEGKALQLEVGVFDLPAHPRAMLCYAWYVPETVSDKPRAVTVLREGPIRSSADAVRFVLDEEDQLR